MMMKFLLSTAGAVLIGGFTPAFAGTVEYTFYDSNGVAYCDGITLNENHGIAKGTMTGCGGGAFAGGIEGGKLPHLDVEDSRWIITTSIPPGDCVGQGAQGQDVYVLDQKALTFTLYEQCTAQNIKFTEINSGDLVEGAPEDLELAGKVLGTRSAASPGR